MNEQELRDKFEHEMEESMIARTPKEIANWWLNNFRGLLKKRREAVEGLKYDEPLLGTSEPTVRTMRAVNNTLDDVLSILSE